MASPSKEEKILNLILENSPLKHWHFEEIVKESNVTRAVASKWLKKYVKEGLLQHKKEKGTFPHYTAGQNNPVYQAKKRFYALEQLYSSGLIDHLLQLQNATTVIVFGSMAKGDWYKDSDIDLFIYGSAEGFEKEKFEQRLKRKIELHLFENRKELNEVKTGLVKNIINGYLVKGNMEEIAEAA